jgi:hypothetical protein
MTTADDLYPQLKNSLDSFEKMSAKERESKVSAYYAERVNDLLSLSKEAMPNVTGKRWPNAIPVTKPAMGPGHGEANYSDVRAILSEITAIVSTGRTPPEFFVV